MRSTALAASAALLVAAGAATAQTVTQITPGSHFHGVHGIRFAPGGELYAGSVIGQTLYAVDVETGAVRVVEGPPKGMADDIAFGPGGQVVWTAISQGIVYTRRGDGPVEVLAKDMPGANSVAFSRDGRHLYLGQVFAGDGVWELDASGKAPPRRITGPVGGFNSFAVGPDGALYGPLWFKGQVARIDPQTGDLKVIAEGLQTPAAVKFDSKDNLYAIDTKVGVLYRIDIATGAKTKVAQLKPSLDNMEFGKGDRLFISNMVDNGIEEVDVRTGGLRQVLKRTGLSNAADIAVLSEGGKDTLYVADSFAMRMVDGATGEIRDIARSYSDDIGNPQSVGAQGDRVYFVGGPRIDVRDRAGRRVGLIENLGGAAADVAGAPNGDVLILLADGDLVRASGDARIKVASGLKTAVSLAAGPDDTAFVVERDAGRVVRIDLRSGAVTEAAAGFAKPRAVAVRPDGSLIVLDSGAKSVIEVAADGKRTVLARDLPLGHVAAAPWGGVAIGGSGAVYVAADGDNSIWRITR
ncbi:SMP-30/gluconolactonase/LRE family protein [Phenylobacterium sp.]|uniref:SMP-30/gluconolactonase/LRE family protein n=1 Tax=Phenylobacterium sp. TaxID=1871053 RepID=UPI0025DDDBCA|nr:SMP-30/gluconolactonase/LRE family protein [Phenylobacterium sp.]MBX3484676.1 SMP-30/gluconolactonase/LRE family protein [Phenylobacterium sp.]